MYNKIKQSVYNKTYWKKYPEKYKLKRLRTVARRKGLDFNITEEDIVVPEICPILGIPLVSSSIGWDPANPSVDRIDNSKGYIKGNVQIISHRANSIKRDLSLQQIENLYKYSKHLL